MTLAPLLIAGPSGSGKTYLSQRLSEQYPIRLVLSSMTRQPREGERNLVDNEYLTDDQFDAVAESGDFFMINGFFGQRYGYRRSFIAEIQSQGYIPVAIVFTPTVEQFFAVYPESFGVYLLPASLELIASRMRKRGDTEAEITKRLISAEHEIEAYHHRAELFRLTARIAKDDDIDNVISAIAAQYQLD